MSLDELIQHLARLGPDDRGRVEAYLESLEKRQRGTASPRRSLKGALSKLNVQLTLEDFEAARRDFAEQFDLNVNPSRAR